MSTLEQVVKQSSLKKPCADCPFRKDRTGIKGLAEGRRTGIIDELVSGQAGTFHCHKTIDYDDENESVMERKHCAGAVATAIKAGGAPKAVLLAMRMGLIEVDYFMTILTLDESK